jgi:hypothetical protein
MADQRTPHGDEAELFRTYNATLMRDVARSVTVVDPGVVEDACSFAWMQVQLPRREATVPPLLDGSSVFIDSGLARV